MEASMESLALAITGLGLPSRREFREPSSQYAASIGLIGAAAEQAMAALLIQTYGAGVLLKTENRYKTFREVLDETRSLLRNPVPRASFLTSGIKEEKAHRESLYGMTTGFLLLATERAVGLHAGNGPSRSVACVTADRVSQFLAELSKSNRIRTYLEGFPVPPHGALSPNLLIDDLIAKLASAKKPHDRAALLGSIFLVLPEIPQNVPEWIGAFDRIAIAPNDNDLSLLITTLETAIPVQLRKVSIGSGAPLGVAIKPGDPSALPIAPHQLRRSFTEISDQFGADVGSANGRLATNLLDLAIYCSLTSVLWSNRTLLVPGQDDSRPRPASRSNETSSEAY